MGEVDEFKSTEDFLMSEFNESYEIELISIKEIVALNEKEECNEVRIVILIREILDSDNFGTDLYK